jgi:phosphatidylserine/phosphatidylglycerophosphate/cardiolipin synthase-like enzyme
MASHQALINDPDPDLRFVVVEGGGPSMTHEANIARLSEIAARGWEEHLAVVDGRTAVMRNEFMLIRFVDGVPRNLPESASETLKAIVQEVASRRAGTPEIAVGYRGEAKETEQVPIVYACDFDPTDVVIGGSAQLTLLKKLFETAKSRVIIHSTFLDHNRFKDLIDDIRCACLRGVRFDLLWGAEVADDAENRNAKSAVHIARMLREHREIYQNFQLHMRTTGSHAKILLVDDAKGDWIAAIGSCNWLSSPFNAVEVTVVLRDPHVVADVAVGVQRMVGRRGLSDDIATEMSLVASELRALPRKGGAAKISLIVGDGHDAVMRRASGEARRRIVVGTHRLGSTARPGMLMQAEVAAKRATDMDVVMLYTQASGPLKNRHARKLAEEAALSGMRLLKTPIPLHGKFVAWDSNDLVVTSLNWGSATSDVDFPQADIGVHIEAPGIADGAVAQLRTIFPDIVQSDAQPATF